ncbi:MAG: hypothetical protein MJ151_04135 [Lachnospiraceae bacterium]|nr:hypothetical protein [Lachnospiraceae bacterium]
MNYKIDIKRIIDEQIHIQGWVLPADVNEKGLYEIYDSNANKIDYKFVAMKRQDVEGIYLGKETEGLIMTRGYNGAKMTNLDGGGGI